MRRSAYLMAVMLSLGVGFFVGSTLQRDAKAREVDQYTRLDTFAQVLSHIERNYVETVDSEKLVLGAVRGLVRALDPHSAYLTVEELKSLRDRTAGQFVGVGIELGVRDASLMIIAPLPGGPAERAGLKAGDVILNVDDVSTKDWGIEDAIKALRGPEGSTVRLGISRKGEPRPLEFILERQLVKLVSVEKSLLEPGYALIAVRSFASNIGFDVRQAYDELVEQNGEALKGLVLDLRGNPGGLLREAVDLSNVFLESGLIVTTEGRGGLELDRHEAKALRSHIETPLVVLINGASASAAEIVAGALQDHKRAVLVGSRSFGKGSVQNIYDLEDGSGLKLTIARYYTPSHRSIQGHGITPDIEAPDIELPLAAQDASLHEADLPGALRGDGTAPESKALGEESSKSEAKAEQALRDYPLSLALNQLKAHHILSGAEQ
ncbi:MAG: S41 family peptidase [Myxococcota bacterium]|jgi:carboxyl-terminal processing protease|nr:S41 family peptidase [Myxococcota bacterium]